MRLFFSLFVLIFRFASAPVCHVLCVCIGATHRMWFGSMRLYMTPTCAWVPPHFDMFYFSCTRLSVCCVCVRAARVSSEWNLYAPVYDLQLRRALWIT